MLGFSLKNDTPVSTLYGNDRFGFGCPTTDRPQVIEASNLLTAMAAVATGFSANTFLARASTGAAGYEPITDYGLSLVSVADASGGRTALGLGTLATQSGTFSGTHSGSSSGANTGDQTLSSLGGTTVGQNFFTLTNPSAITFPRINADNSVSALSASDFRMAIGAGTGGGSVISVATSGGLTGGTITTTGTLSLDLAYSPTWTGAHTFSGTVVAGLVKSAAAGGAFTGAVNTVGLQFDTVSSSAGIEMVTSVSGSGSGTRIRSTSAGLLVDVRANAATFTNAFTLTTAGAITLFGSLATTSDASFGGAALSVNGTFSVFRGAAGTLYHGLTTDATAGNVLLSLTSGAAVTGHTFGVFTLLNTTGVGFANYSQQNGSGPLWHHLLTVGAGDVQTTYEINGVTTWSIGIDNSNSDRFTISLGASPGTNEYFGITTAGAVIIPGTLTTGAITVGTGGSAAANLGGVIYSNVTPAGNGASATTDVFSRTIPADTLAADGQSIRGRCYVTFGGSGGQRFEISFAGTVIFDTNVVSSVNNVTVGYEIVRTSTGNQKSVCLWGVDGILIVTGSPVTAAASTGDETTGLTLKFICTGIGADDVQVQWAKDEWLPAQ